MRKDPLPVFCFHVQLPGYGNEAFFKSVNGLRYETEIVPVKEGGQNLTTYQLVGSVKWSNIVLKQGFASDDALFESLKAHVKGKAGAWKYPRWIDVRADLPKTATGKIQRFKLREEDASKTA